MKSIRKILTFLFLLMAGLIVVGLSLPADWAAEASVETGVAPAELYPLVEDLRAWPDWAVWFEHDPEMRTEFSEPSRGPGAHYEWAGNTAVGEGRLELLAVETGQSVTLRLTMNDAAFLAEGKIVFTPIQGGTRVSWRLGGALGKDPFGRLNRPLLQNAVAGTLQASLENLKREAERP